MRWAPWALPVRRGSRQTPRRSTALGGLTRARQILLRILLADSKQLTEEQREKLFEVIKGAPDTVGWAVTVLQPQHISESMLRKYAWPDAA